RNEDLDVRIDAVVLHAPAEPVEPERELRHRHPGAIDKLVPAFDANHSAPGPGADNRSDAERADRTGDDVAVRCRLLVRDRDDWPARRLVWVTGRLGVARDVPADDSLR